MCALQRTFFFHAASSNFITVSIICLVQIMTVSPLPADWSLFENAQREATSGNSPASVTLLGSTSLPPPVCAFSRVLFTPKPRAQGHNRSYLCWKSSSTSSATSRTALILDRVGTAKTENEASSNS